VNLFILESELDRYAIGARIVSGNASRVRFAILLPVFVWLVGWLEYVWETMKDQ